MELVGGGWEKLREKLRLPTDFPTTDEPWGARALGASPWRDFGASQPLLAAESKEGRCAEGPRWSRKEEFQVNSAPAPVSRAETNRLNSSSPCRSWRWFWCLPWVKTKPCSDPAALSAQLGLSSSAFPRIMESFLLEKPSETTESKH